MYEIKPILPKFDITLPTCMYSIKPILNHTTCNGVQDEKKDTVSDVIGEQIRLCLKASSGMSELEKRQENLLKQLQNLRNQLLGIRSQIDLTKQKDNVSHKTITTQPTKEISYAQANVINCNEIFDDLVINAGPDCIPYGLLALKNAWKGIFNINVTVHSHSTVSNLSQEAKEFQNKISKNTNTNQNCPHINIVLIWKNSEHTEMVTSSATYVPIYGEVNVLRYLARIGPKEYRYENDNFCNEMDAVLDMSYQLPCCCGAKTKNDLLKSLNNRLQKRKYFGGNNWNIADIGAFSALKRSLWLKQKDLTDDLSKWYERMFQLIAAV